MRMSPGIWNLVFLATFFFAFYNHLSESEAHSDHHKKLSPAIVVGTVYCETCFHQDFSKSSHFISGATVAVECRDSSANNSRPNFRELVKTNEHGEFKVNLPFSVSKHVKKIKACSVKLISSSEPFCAVASTATSSLLRLKSRKEGTHIFSAGFFTFKPLKQPQVCDQKPSIRNPRKKNLKAVDSSISTDPNNPAFLPPIRDPPSSPDLPLVPNLPGFPTLPPLPVPEIPYIPPVPTKEPSKESRKTSELADKQAVQQRIPSGSFPFLPPNPLLPPPSIIPPVLPTPPPSIFPPIFPAPPPSIFPPIFPAPPPSIFPPILPSPPSPPPSIFPPLIPLPGLNPPPPPPRAPSFPFPIPLPPGFPGVPPASEPKKCHP